MSIKIIFILHNIYDCINGVSTKYIKFIDYIVNTQTNYNVVLFTPSDTNSDNINLKIIKTKFITIPFYKDIKIPILKKKTLEKELEIGNEIIIFNGEFVWIYNILYELKLKYNRLKIYPNMHTDYVYYSSSFTSTLNFNFTSILNYLDKYLQEKIFEGIIVTGEKMRIKYIEHTNLVFNANEVNLNIFNVSKIDNYTSNKYNLIYCGRISKEKNIEEVLDCCLEISNKYYITLNIIGDGPYTDTLHNIIDIKYSKIKNQIIFHGSKTQEEISNIYQTLDNRIFIFTSMSETFGKTPMEAGAIGIPIFIKKSDMTDFLYINKINAYIFNDINTFSELFTSFVNLNKKDKIALINNSINNIKKYDQNIIFINWFNFIINGVIIKNKIHINLFDMLSFNGISKLISCSETIL
jgi:glycosyltransferase involved in cell wall biosynthesis